MGLAFFRALCCSNSRDIPIASSPDNSPKRIHGETRKTQQNSIPSPLPPTASTTPPPSKPARSSQIGPILGKPYIDINLIYQMEKELGRGQSGVTYLCKEKATNRRYACKSIPRGKLLKKAEIEDVRREVMILQHLSGQPNIVEFRGAYEDRQHLHLVMELCAGGELFDYIIDKGSFTEREAASVMRQIVNAVHVCHFMGVMHRDIKPENFLLANKGDKAPIKTTDFGLSVFIEEG